jgi:hypothetical protein
LLIGGIAYLVFLALADRPINQTDIIPQATIPVDKKQAIVLTEQKQPIIATDKQQTTIMVDQKQAIVSADQKQPIASTERKQAMVPEDQKQSIAPNDKQATVLDDKQEAIVPDKQRAIATDDKQQAMISSRSMHDAPAEGRSSYNLTSTAPDATIEPVKNSALVPPDRNVAVPAHGGYVVQVSAERSDVKAQTSFKTLQSRYPHVLGGRSPLIRRVKLGEKGIFYRAQIGPFDTVEQAQRLCARLKSAGGQCMVQKNS